MQTLTDPAILFFVFGVFAGLVKSNLEIPAPIARFLSLYLLMALGLKGGFALAQSGLTAQVATGLGLAIGLAVAVPIVGYLLLSRFIPRFDAAAVAATYGSVSAVTFITATAHLDNQGIAYGGHMAAAMALMESPAIILAVLMANALRRSQAAPVRVGHAGNATLALHGGGQGFSLPKVLHESFTDGAQLLLLGAMAVGLFTGEAGQQAMQPFSGDLFKGMLAFFLLEMGLVAAGRLADLRQAGPFLLIFAIGTPICAGLLSLLTARLLDFSVGNSVLLATLYASASYIAAPAAMRIAVPEANPALSIGASLGVTFPFNLIAGIPLYHWLATYLKGALA